MKHPFHFSILPYFTMGAGGIGLCLRLWPNTAKDEKDLLPAGHAACILLYILTALTLGALFLATRKPGFSPYRRSFRRIAETAGNLLAAIGLVLHVLFHEQGILAIIICLVGALFLLLAAFFSFKKKALPYQLGVLITAALMLFTVTQCRTWGALPQLQHYFFPLLASIFLILTAYHRTNLAARHGKRTNLAFFSQCALFLCCLSLNTNPVLYFGMACWAAVQLFTCYLIKKES